MANSETQKVETSNTQKDLQLAPRSAVPSTGVFGRLDDQARALFGEIALERMDALNEMASHEKEINHLIKNVWVKNSKQRLDNWKEMAKQQGMGTEESPEENPGC